LFSHEIDPRYFKMAANSGSAQNDSEWLAIARSLRAKFPARRRRANQQPDSAAGDDSQEWRSDTPGTEISCDRTPTGVRGEFGRLSSFAPHDSRIIEKMLSLFLRGPLAAEDSAIFRQEHRNFKNTVTRLQPARFCCT
jgi:hypothetical protein